MKAINKIVLNRPFFPDHMDNIFKETEGNVVKARKRFFDKKSKNLKFLLENRYNWMNKYINDKEKIIEVGSGTGVAKEILKKSNIILTDVNKYPWIDEYVNVLNMPYEDNSIDIIISSHMIHHTAKPLLFFNEATRVLKPGGMLLINEINTSTLMRILLRLAKHEGWSYDTNVFDETIICNNPNNPWSANCAIPEMLFFDQEKFKKYQPKLNIIRNELCEGFIFPLSGGVIIESPTIQLPIWILKTIKMGDKLLIKLFPNFFAFGRRVVIQKS